MDERLDRLERTVADLAREVRDLRAELNRRTAPGETGAMAAEPPVSPLSAPPLPMPPARPTVGPLPPAGFTHPTGRRTEGTRRAGPGRRAVDFESLIGRYGTLALASLTILMGVGAFLGWAIAQGKIGPGTRVALGGLAAIAVAIAGWRLRSKGSRRFGSTLLALSLALVHVDAWGAGPYLGLIPSGAALGIAAAASAALAALAWRGREEALFSVGVGGALLAPFVTSSQSGNTVALLAYGFLVLAIGLVALRDQSWRTATTVVTVGCWLYTATGVGTIRSDAGALERDLPPLFALAVAWVAVSVVRAAAGARVARASLVALLGAIISMAADRSPATDLLLLAAGGTATAYVIARAHPADQPSDRPSDRRRGMFTAAVLPLAFGVVALFTVRDAAVARGGVALAWALGALGATRVAPALRDTHYMVAGIASGASILLALERRPIAWCVGLAGHAAALALVMRRTRVDLLAVPIALGLIVITARAFDLLGARPLYGYTPFATGPSLAALAVSAAWLVVSWNASRTTFDDGRDWGIEARTAIRLAGAVVTFLWGRAELARAYSADVATFLLIFYYAAVGVAAIFVGRRRRISVLRHVGLALAIFAALKAVAQASSLAIGLRVGSYFLAGVFLLAVAYWYRARDDEPTAAEGVERTV